ncbi:F-box protein [Canna indica]|uniref:F-box protein n=1 Tax=Canna indica TaxID=4628 RepID=A0AAQ3QJ93_9LILI|nr:F-box protein [Canna indica]
MDPRSDRFSPLALAPRSLKKHLYKLGTPSTSGSRAATAYERAPIRPDDEGDDKTQCRNCDKEFASWKALFGHMRTHSSKAQEEKLAACVNMAFAASNCSLFASSCNDNEDYVAGLMLLSRGIREWGNDDKEYSSDSCWVAHKTSGLVSIASDKNSSALEISRTEFKNSFPFLNRVHISTNGKLFSPEEPTAAIKMVDIASPAAMDCTSKLSYGYRVPWLARFALRHQPWPFAFILFFAPLPSAMRTRRGVCYTRPQFEAQWRAAEEEKTGRSRKRRKGLSAAGTGREVSRRKMAAEGLDSDRPDLFDGLPDDLVVSILCKLSASATSPSDLVSVTMTCKRMKGLGSNPAVLAKASLQSLAVRAKNWSESAHKFLKQCADAGNIEACYILGMIRFYCLQNRSSGASLMARAAMGSHAAALYSLAVIQFNGSGGSKGDKDLHAGVALCARAAFLGHVDALRELGHCLQDGYGVRRNVAEGRRFLVQANARELAAVLKSSSASAAAWRTHHRHALASGCSLLSDFGCNVPPPEAHPANRFMAEWFAARGTGNVPGEEGLRLCSHAGCGRPETRRHEFRRCSVCGAVNYCSRACQALHWKLVHKAECSPMDRWLDAAAAEAAAGVAPPEVGGGDMVINRDVREL